MAALADATSGQQAGGGIVKLMNVDDFDDADKWTDISEDDERSMVAGDIVKNWNYKRAKITTGL